MKAVVCNAYGPPEVLKLAEFPKPKPKDNEILVKVVATAVNSADVRIRGLNVSGWMKPIMRLVLGFTKPRNPILGVVFAGVVVEVGSNVKEFKVHDEVYGSTGFKCGAHAEFIAVRESGSITLKPKKASFEEAASLLFGAQTAIYFLRKAKINKGQNVLIYGATGAVGVAAVQLALYYGAQVTAVCGPNGVDLIKSLGVKKVLDYKKDDVSSTGKQYNIVFDAVGKLSKQDRAKLMNDNCKFVTVAGLDVSSEKKSDLVFLADLFDRNEYRAVIDKTYSLEDIVEAHHYVDTGRKKGCVVITVQHL